MLYIDSVSKVVNAACQILFESDTGPWEEDFYSVYTIYGHGGHLGHVTWMFIYTFIFFL